MKKIVLTFLLICLITGGFIFLKPIILRKEVIQYESIILGSKQQQIYVKTYNKKAPILLVLHGGPGLPQMPLSHMTDDIFLKHFTVVHWDQLGSGKSFNKDLMAYDISLDRLIGDALELVDKLLIDYNTKDVYVVGHSWGSILGLTLVSEHYQKFKGYIGVAQIVDTKESVKVSYDLTLKEAQNVQNELAIKELKKIGAPPYESVSDLLVERKWVSELGGFLYGKGQKEFDEFFKTQISKFNDYTYEEFMSGFGFSIQALWSDLFNTNFYETQSSLPLPTCFIVGEKDFVAPYSEIKRYVNNLTDLYKPEIFELRNAAHFPMYEVPEEYQKKIVKWIKSINN